MNLIPIARQLPIFRNYSGNFGLVAPYLSPSDQIHQSLLNGLPEFLDIPAVSVELARALGAAEIPILDFYTKFVFPRIHTLEPSIRDPAMLRLLRGLPEIEEDNFKSHLSKLEFVPSPSGTQS